MKNASIEVHLKKFTSGTFLGAIGNTMIILHVFIKKPKLRQRMN